MEQSSQAVVGPLEPTVRPCAWVRRNGGFNSGVANFGADCPPGWKLAAEPMYDRAALDAAVAAERERCAKICEAQEYSYWRATEDQDFTPQDCADAIRRA